MKPIYFPFIQITDEDCRNNPGNIKYPESYIIFNDKTYELFGSKDLTAKRKVQVCKLCASFLVNGNGSLFAVLMFFPDAI